MSWKNCKIVSLRKADVFIEKGFKPRFSYSDEVHKRITPSNPPQLGVVYVKGDLNVWSTVQGWQTAMLLSSQYTNHKPFKTETEIFEHYKL